MSSGVPIDIRWPFIGFFVLLLLGLVVAALGGFLDKGAAAALAGASFAGALAVLALQNLIAGPNGAFWTLPECYIKKLKVALLVGPVLVGLGLIFGHLLWP